ncbi:hypothetical protein Rctr85_008 [Virus Rctr85]|nr:hypothetical protein Rctr85_008 [Virus Rctr85]
MAYTPAWWGPQNGIDSKDYILHMQGAGGVSDVPVSLLGHSLTSPSQNLTDALQFVETRLRNGRVTTVSRTKRAAYETSRTYTVGFPSALWTPLMERSILGGCTTALFMMYQCPEDRIYDHVDILPDATLNPAIEAEDVITTGEDTNIITHTSELQVPEKIRQWRLGFERIYDAAGTVAYNDIALLTEDCPGCDFVAGQGVIVAGGDGTAVPDVQLTDDRFGSVTALTGLGIATDTATAVFSEGDLVLVALTESGADPDGKLYVSRDRGVSFAVVAGFTDIVNAFAKLGNTIIAIGDTGGASTGATVYLSEDQGSTWSEVTASAVTALTTQALNHVAVDPATGRIYMVADGGKMLVARLSGSTLTVSDISANTGAGINNLNAVAVLAKNHVVIGGAAGFAAESKNGGVTFAVLDVPGSDAIGGLDGNIYRLVIGAGTKLYERSLITKNAITEIVPENGQTLVGAVTRVKMGLEGNMNQFFAVTASGEVVLGRGFYPNA